MTFSASLIFKSGLPLKGQIRRGNSRDFRTVFFGNSVRGIFFDEILWTTISHKIYRMAIVSASIHFSLSEKESKPTLTPVIEKLFYLNESKRYWTTLVFVHFYVRFPQVNRKCVNTKSIDLYNETIWKFFVRIRKLVLTRHFHEICIHCVYWK